MSYSIVGEQIQKFRKEIGLTQKELGETIGVSSSAVSQWESGGTPDISLLPAIADKLRVTIDALFGREGGEVRDMKEAFSRWIRTIPEEKQMDQLCHLMLEVCKLGMADLGPDSVGYLRAGEMKYEKDEMILMPTFFVTDSGEILGTFADDISWVSILPEPEAGYSTYFAYNEEYRNFFSILLQPNVLEIMQYLASIEYKYYTPGAIAKRMDLPLEAVEEALTHMVKARLVHPLNMENESGSMEAYVIRKQYLIPPFFYFSRLMLQSDNLHLKWDPRRKPILKTNDK